MNDLQIFKNDQFGEIRTISKYGQTWFVAKDISNILGYSETNRMTTRLDDDESISTRLEGMNMNSTLINESGLYSAVLGSQKPESKKFKKWVTSEVLPTIRKHGAYMTDNTIEKALMDPDFLIKLATNLKEEKFKRLEAENKIELDRPKVIFADAVSVSHTSILVGELAKLLKQNGID
ncbi:BRO family protein, partial [Clostridium sp.]|uniref:BRO family protein n=1 Tax=Clostridium sp. TaxID=1506 RepID=UPI001A63978F